MNTDDFKTSLSKIRPDEETKQRMLKNILEKRNVKCVHRIKFIPYATAAAAAVFLFAGGFLYYHGAGTVETEKVAVKEDVSVTQAESTEDETFGKSEQIEVLGDGKADGVKTKTSADDNFKNLPIEKTEEKTVADNYDSARNEQASGGSSDEKLSGVKVAVNDISNETDEIQNLNSTDFGISVASDFVETADTTAVAQAKTVIKTMDEDEYLSYLGQNFKENLYVPSGYSYSGFGELYADCDDEGNLLNDTADFLYIGESDSYFYIKTTKKDVNLAMEEKNGYEKSYFGGKDVVITKENDTYNAYFVSDGIFYSVRSYLVLKDEFIKIIKSLM